MDLSSRERVLRMYEHKEADRIPFLDVPWKGTIKRWEREGMPENMDWRDYFGTDKLYEIGTDISPKFENRIIEETNKYKIYTTSWGVTIKTLKEEDCTPEFLDFKVVNNEEWNKAKIRITDSIDSLPLYYLKENYDKWLSEGAWLTGCFWFGFDNTHSGMTGLETLLIAFVEDPDWVKEIFNTTLDHSITHMEMLWDMGYRFDCIKWSDDMGYKGTSFFSPEMYRDLLMPAHKRAVEWAHSKGIYAYLHSCGNIMGLLDDIMSTGIDALNPLEVKAGMDSFKIKKQYGDRLVLHGGINAVKWDKKDEIIAEIEEKVPVLKQNGGYIFASDHSIPNSVSLENMKLIVDAVKRCGSYK